MPRLHASTEQKLLKAVELTAQLVEDSDCSPNTALTKIAKDLQLRQGEIRVVARTYNTGKANAIRESGETLLDKTAAFDNADAEAVISEIFPDTVKQASATVDESLFSIDYFWSPESLLPKAAAAKAPDILEDIRLESGTYIPPAQDEVLLARKMSQKVAKLVKTIEYWREKESAAVEQQVEAVANLAAYFDTGSGLPLASVKRAAATYFGRSEQLILEAAELAIPRIKSAAHNVSDNVAVGLTSPVFALIEAVKEATANRQWVEGTNINIHKGMRLLAEDVGEEDTEDSVLPARRKQAAIPNLLSPYGAYEVLNNSGRALSGQMANVDDKDALQTALSDIASPDHEQKLKQIAVKANLQKLLTQDPVIKGYTPQQVAEAFNQYAQLSPNSIDRDLPVRMGLRRQLSQDGIETHDQQQLVDLDSDLAGVRTPKQKS